MNVDKLVDYKLQLAGLPLGNQEFDYVVDTEFFARMDSSEIHSGLVNVAINVNNSQNCYTLDFSVTGDSQITCDRCLDEMTHHVDDSYRLTVRIGDNAADDADANPELVLRSIDPNAAIGLARRICPIEELLLVLNSHAHIIP